MHALSKQIRWQRRQRALGHCVDCGSADTHGQRMCVPCRERDRRGARRRKGCGRWEDSGIGRPPIEVGA